MSSNQFTEDSYEQTLIQLFKVWGISMNAAMTWSEISASRIMLLICRRPCENRTQR